MKKGQNSIIKECYEKSIELLKNNSSKYGFLAAAPQKKARERNYLSIFSRDASICSLGALASCDKELIKTAKRSILTLARKQADNGQIPNYVKPENGGVDFWRLGCIDATLWWLIVVELYDRNSSDKKLKIQLKKHIKKALFWLECQTHVEDRLVMQNEASDWADLMPRSGKVLYSNALWCYVNSLYKLRKKAQVFENFNNLFYPFDNKNKKIVPKCERRTIMEIRKTEKDGGCYLSYVGYLYWGQATNVYANALSVIFGLPAKKLQEKIVNTILNKKRKKDLPIPVLFNPIKEHSREWRKYMESHKQNYPSQYHNGGVWPFVSCFWAITLARSGKKEEAAVEFEKIAMANKNNNWEFNEWFHARTGKACGMKGQSWNAGMFIFAYQYIENRIKLF